MNEDIKTDLESDKNFYAPHPRKAQKIIGHEQVREKFLASYHSGKLHHAWLICGPEGIGKATLAWQIAKLLLNKGTSFDETNFPSNTIVSQRLEALSEPSLFLCRRQFDKVKKKYFQDISVEEIRKIKHFFSLTSTQSNWRIVIIDTIDDLSNSAANSLLKVLEEPPKGGLFLLICKNKNNLLPTIISRCQLLECGYLSLNEFEKILIDLKIFDTKEHDLQVLFSLINGSISKAIDFKLNNGLNILRKIASIIGFQKKMNRKDIWEILDKNNSSLNQKEYYQFTQQLLLMILSRIAAGLVKKEDGWNIVEEEKIFNNYRKYPSSYSVFALLHLEIINDFYQGNKLNSDPVSLLLEAFIKIEEALLNIKVQ